MQGKAGGAVSLLSVSSSSHAPPHAGLASGHVQRGVRGVAACRCLCPSYGARRTRGRTCVRARSSSHPTPACRSSCRCQVRACMRVPDWHAGAGSGGQLPGVERVGACACGLTGLLRLAAVWCLCMLLRLTDGMLCVTPQVWGTARRTRRHRWSTRLPCALWSACAPSSKQQLLRPRMHELALSMMTLQGTNISLHDAARGAGGFCEHKRFRSNSFLRYAMKH